MIEENTFESATEQEYAEKYVIQDDEDIVGGNINEQPEQAIDMARKQRIKTNLIVAGTTIVFNAIPIIIEHFKHRKDPVPYKCNKSNFVRLGISSLIPILSTVDDLMLNGKIQNKVPLSDIGNIVNIVSAYPAAHKSLNDFVTNVVRTNSNKQPIPTDPSVTHSAWVGVANIAAPYIVGKLTNDNLSFGEKVNSTIPLPIVGRFIRTFMMRDPNLARVYDVGTNVVRAASGINRSIGSAVRPSQGSTVNKAIDKANGLLDTASELMGLGRGNSGYGNNNRGNYGNGGGGYNSYDRFGGGGGSRWF